MTSRKDCVVLAFGLTTLYVSWLIGPLINPNHLAVYHWAGSMYGLFLPPTLDFLFAFLLLTLFLLSLRIRQRWQGLGWAFLLSFSPWFMLKNALLLYPALPSHRLGWLLLLVGSMGLFCYVFLQKFRDSSLYNAAVDLFLTFLRFASVGGLLLLAQVAWFGWQARALNRELPTHFAAKNPVPHRQQPRILWIVLDELSYQQTYGHRFPGLQLPTFDRLAATSTVFTQVAAAGSETEKVLPSLLTGEPIDEVRSSAVGMLGTHNPVSKAWANFQQDDTVFHDAIAQGYGTALAGWYNPYCRIMPAVLGECWWTFGANDTAMEWRSTVARNMLGPLRYELLVNRSYRSLQRLLPLRDSETLSAEVHTADLQDLSRAADEMVRNPENSFILLHLPLPHPGGIYNRRTGTFTNGSSSYLDNLALADSFLSHLEKVLRETGQWDSSTVVIMGDHGWRTNIAWTGEPGWTAEDEAASKTEALNRRPAMIVKLPGQQQGTRIDEPFRAVRTRKLMNAFFSHSIATSADLRTWVQQNR